MRGERTGVLRRGGVRRTLDTAAAPPLILRGVSAPDVWIESERVRVQSALLVSGLGGVVLASVAAALAVLVVLAPDLFGVPLDGAAWSMLLFAPIAAALVYLRRRLRTDGAGAIGVAAGALVIMQGLEKKQIPLADLASGRSSPGRGEVGIRLRSGARIIAAVPRAEDAERLLVAAGLDASRRPMRFELGETTLLDWVTVLLAPVLVLPVTQAIVRFGSMPWGARLVLSLIVLALLFSLVRAAFGPAKLTVGADGIAVDRPLRHRFVPFGRLASVALSPSAVDLVLTDGSRVRARASTLTDVQQGDLRARIDAALAAFHCGLGVALPLARLDREGRPLAAWRAALQAIPEHDGTYRDALPTRAQLFEVLESAASPAERRLGAALSLSASNEAAASARIRVAAEACANPRVRVALARVADGGIDDAAIDEALADDEVAHGRV